MKLLAAALTVSLSFGVSAAIAQVAAPEVRSPAAPSEAIDCADPAYRMDNRCVGAATLPERPGPAGQDLTTGATPPPAVTPPPIVTSPAVPATPR